MAIKVQRGRESLRVTKGKWEEIVWFFVCSLVFCRNCNERSQGTQHDWMATAKENHWFECIKYQCNVHQHMKCTKSLFVHRSQFMIVIFSSRLIKHCLHDVEYRFRTKNKQFFDWKWNLRRTEIFCVLSLTIFAPFIVSLNKQKVFFH